jgi:hypothetical protein
LKKITLHRAGGVTGAAKDYSDILFLDAFISERPARQGAAKHRR